MLHHTTIHCNNCSRAKTIRVLLCVMITVYNEAALARMMVRRHTFADASYMGGMLLFVLEVFHDQYWACVSGYHRR